MLDSIGPNVVLVQKFGTKQAPKLVIKVKLRNVIQRGKIFYFRVAVPTDCRETIGQSEIKNSLETENPLDAQKKADQLTAEWKSRFDDIRSGKLKKKPAAIKRAAKRIYKADDKLNAFRDQLALNLEANLPPLMRKKTNRKLKELSDYYQEQILFFEDDAEILAAGCMHLELPELGLTGLWRPDKVPGVERQRRRIFVDALQTARLMIDVELGKDYSKNPEVAKLTAAKSTRAPAAAVAPVATTVNDDYNMFTIAQLMVDSRNRNNKTQHTIKAEAQNLSEWCDGKVDIRSFGKRDLIGFVNDCLPYIPRNAKKQKIYQGVPLRKQIAMVKSDPKKYIPISETTCGNRLNVLSSLFNYAKDQLGYISINPVKGLEVQGIRSVPKTDKAYTPDELVNFHIAVQAVRSNEPETSGRFWIPMIGLYHGFRLNEVCSLFGKDVYQADGDTWVIDVNADGKNKSVKNKSSVRIVPIHPHILELGFLDYVAARKSKRSDGLLFPDLTWSKNAGYARRLTNWFNKWKTTWLPVESCHKNFHGFRYTFIQTAQNVAELPLRYTQEIVGHQISGASDVHLGYSGRLKPAALLEELQKVRYGWE